MKTIQIADAHKLPFWQRPEALLFLLAFAMPMAFSTWSALLNNFVIEKIGFTGVEIGWLHTVREIPGFFAIGVLLVLLIMREQVLAVISLLLLGVASAVTAWFPSFGGILMITLLSSIGFHYLQTVNQSLQLQWLSKERAPIVLGRLVAAGSAASLLSYGVLVLTWKSFDLSYNFVYLASGGITALIALFAHFAYPKFETPNPQSKKIILKKRYSLYYALTFMAGARRQIFVVFAAFMMVEKFGFEVHEITALFLINYIINMVVAPMMGKVLAIKGERFVLVFEYIGLIIIFLAYGGIYWFGWGLVVACVLYVIDHMLFGLAFAMKTYFQKIADPEDFAPTAAVAFTINHIAAVFLPVSLGYLWAYSPSFVFTLAALLAAGSLVLALLIPRHPQKGNEWRFFKLIKG